MTKLFKNGRIVILLRGKYAGHKAVIFDNFFPENKEKKIPKISILGIKNYPKRITRKMDLKAKQKRSRVKVFIKKANKKHLFVTRYSFEGFEKLISVLNDGPTASSLSDIAKNSPISDPKPDSKTDKALNILFSDYFLAGDNSWFFSKLKF